MPPRTEPAHIPPPPDSEAPPVGTIIASKYRVERLLGAGGMGLVVAAEHLELGNRVAIKFLRSATLKDADAMTRFRREAQAAVRITSEHVARVMDVGSLENGAPYIVMEFLEGTDLATQLRTRGPLPIEEAVEDLLQSCEALAEAHSLGIVHRDLKPANLFCIRRPDGLPWIKVLDFGISKLLGNGGDYASPSGITQSAVVMGSPHYMSPEQMKASRNVDARSDIWALGVILYEILAGVPPFQGESFGEMVLEVATRSMPSLRETRRDCPARLEEIVAKCLEKDRSRRFSDVAALATALAPFGPERARASVERITRTFRSAEPANVTLEATPPPYAAAPSAPTHTLTALGNTAPRRKRTSRPLLWAAGSAMVALALVTAAGMKLVSVRKVEMTAASVSPGATVPLPSSATVAALPSETAVVPPASVLVTTSDAPPTEPAAAPQVPTIAPRPSPKPVKPPAQSVSHGPAATAHAEPAPSPSAPNCNPNYYIDSQGQKRFKPECFSSPGR